MCGPYQTTTDGDPLPHWRKNIEVGKHVWRNYYTGEKLEDYPKPFLPSNQFKDDDRCLVIKTSWPDNNYVIPFNTSWMAKTCTQAWMMCPCQNQDLPALMYLRGLCPSSLLRTKYPDKGLLYTPIQYQPSLLTLFSGGMSSTIHFFENKWRIEDTVHNATAETTASKEDYALGKHEWLITGDDINCQKTKGENYSTFLKLTGCSEGEFTCNDGECVLMEERCDQLPDCRSVPVQRTQCELLSDDSHCGRS